jgi:O-antigen ligase
LFPALGICLYRAIKQHHVKKIAGVVALALCTLATVMLAGERAPSIIGMLSLILAAAIMMSAGRRFAIAGAALIVIVSLMVLVLFLTQEWVQSRVAYLMVNLQDFPQSSYGQLFWMGGHLGTLNWMTGTGLHGFRELCLDYLARGTVTHCNLHPHNPYIEWYAETGLIGVLLFIAMVGSMVRTVIRALKRYAKSDRILPALALATLLVNFFPLMPTQSFFSNWPALLLWFSISVSMASLNLGGVPLLSFARGSKSSVPSA